MEPGALLSRGREHTGRSRATRAVRRWRWVAIGLLPALLPGCNAMSDIFGPGEPEVSRVQTPPEAQGDQPFPNLGTVPDQPPQTRSALERAKITEGLVADRENAEHTDEALGLRPTGAASSAPTPPPPPAAMPAPEEEAATPKPSTSAVEVQPAPPPPQTVAPAAGVESAPAQAPQADASAGGWSSTVQTAQAVPAPQPAPLPSTAPSPQVFEGGSVIVNPDASPLGANPLLPSGETRPVALIFFRHGSASLSRGDIQVLREVVKLHKERGGLIRVIGHASMGRARADDARQNLANFNISLARANAVARELSRLGVPIDQIHVAAAGAQQPLYYETGPTGEAGNRRVEIYLDY